jgi:hypothetical protein
MLITTYFGCWDYWQLYHKVTFDGVNRYIIVNPDVTELDIKRDVYSDWKEWVQLRDYAKFLPAIRVIGGDPTDIAKGKYAGDIYFLMNGWKIIIPQAVNVEGILYADDGASPYIIAAGGGVQATVSNLAQTISTTIPVVTGNLDSIPQAVKSEFTSEMNHLLSLENAPLATDIASQVRTELTPEMSHLLSLENAIFPTTEAIASQVRTELTTELAKINSQVDGLTPSQLTMLREIYDLMGLDPTKPLVVTPTSRTAGTIEQTISGDNTETTVQRV